MTGSPFDDLARDLPDGAFWPTGAWFKRLCAILTSDRARAGSNLEELPRDKGRFFNAKAGGDAVATVAPLTVVAATGGKNAQGNLLHPGRVRVYKGLLGGLRPAQMALIDGVLADGTDQRCYLTMDEGTDFLYGKITVDPSSSLYTGADVYDTNEPETPDGSHLYLLIATVTTTNGVPVIEQNWSGNWSPLAVSSPDGTLTPGGVT